ncbi:MAG: aminotransferase class I/II-fold pyridoxal phosphate-dependent enzyme [Oscillospiraceae bacterium]|jgi:aminotransferase|nr:aminotransferase class I/II-fold pyridoxal phosphate-dependent enzyme [Oscillospiraceae bacterium]
MNIHISSRVRSLKPSGIRRFFDLLEERKDAISLGIGEPDFLTPWHVRDEGIFSLEKGYTKYTPNAGLSFLRYECAAYMSRRFGLDYDPKGEILVTVGGSEAIDLAVRAVLEPGDEVIVPQPSFVAYDPVVTLAGGVPVPVETKVENRFRLTAEQLRGAVTEKTRMLILPYPCNPTGGIMELPDLEAVAAVLRGTGVIVISDEIYAELTYGQKHVPLASLPGMKERTLIVGGLSKSHAMTGWRMGFAYGPAELIGQMTKIHQYAIMSAPTTSQYAAAAALRDGDGEIARMAESYDRRRRLTLEGFHSMGLDCFEPQGAFYLFPSIQSTGLTSEAFCQGLLEEQDVAVIPGPAFGASGEGFVRACYATSVENLTEALERIKRYLEKVRR